MHRRQFVPHRNRATVNIAKNNKRIIVQSSLLFLPKRPSLRRKILLGVRRLRPIHVETAMRGPDTSPATAGHRYVEGNTPGTFARAGMLCRSSSRPVLEPAEQPGSFPHAHPMPEAPLRCVPYEVARVL